MIVIGLAIIGTADIVTEGWLALFVVGYVASLVTFAYNVVRSDA